jgi:hypothetical protein
MNIYKIAMQLLMLLAVLAAIIMPSLAARDEHMNNIAGERKFLQHMREKRRALAPVDPAPFVPQPDIPVR